MSKTFIGVPPARLVIATQEIANAISAVIKQAVVINYGDVTVTGTAFFVEGNRIEISLDTQQLADCRSEEHALKIWRGLAGQQVAHAMWPASQTHEAAKKGMAHLFALLEDERSTRRFIALAPSEAPYLQSLGAYQFSVADASSSKITFGSQFGAPKDGTVAATATYGTRFNSFAYELKRGLPSHNAVAADCMGAITDGFKDLDDVGLLALAGQIHAKLGAGAEVSFADEVITSDEPAPAAAKPVVVPAAAAAKLLKPAQPQSPRDDGPRRPGNNGAIIAKGLMGFLGIATVGWVWVLLHFGYDFWTFLAGVVVLGGAAVGGLLWIFRGPVGAGLRAALKAAGEFIDALRKHPATKVVLVSIAALLVATVVGFIIWKVAPLVILTCISNLAIVVCLIYACSSAVDPQKENVRTTRYFGIGMAVATAVSAVTFGVFMSQLGLPGWLILAAVLVPVVALWSCALTLALPEFGGKGSVLLGAPWRFAAWIIESLRGAVFGIGSGLSVIIAGIGIGLAAVRDLFLAIIYVIGQLIELTVAVVRAIYWNLEPYTAYVFANPITRAIALSGGLGVLVTCLIASINTAGSLVGWVIVAGVVVMLAGTVVLLLINRKTVWRWMVNDQAEVMPGLVGTSLGVPVDKETATWTPISDFVHEVQPDSQFIEKERALVNTLAARLKARLDAAGRRPKEIDEQTDGHDVGDEPEKLLEGDTGIFVDEHDVPVSSVVLAVGIDCSDSTLDAAPPWGEGEKFRRERVFEMVLEEAFRDSSWIDFEGFGFNDSQIFVLGSSGLRASGLPARGANNDTAMLAHLRQRVEHSSRRLKICALLSDIQPSNSSWLSLQIVARQCKQDGLVPWQVQFDVTENPLEDVITTDAHGQELEQVVDEFADRLVALIQERC